MQIENLSWFPGHMTKTKRMISAEIKNMDAVCEIVDARIPLSSRNPDVDELTAGKPRLIVLNRADQADPAETRRWTQYFRAQGCAVLEPERIKKVSGALLAGRTVRFASDWPIAGSPPAGLAEDAAAPELALTLCPAGDALHLVPRIGVLGVGCRRGTGADTLAEAFAAFCAQAGLAPQCIAAAASIDLKQNEAGLLAFCQSRGWPVEFFTAEQLRQAPGSFTPSAFVQSVTGVDNVCERAAVLAAGGPLVFHKFARTGVTFALAARPFAPDWRWQHV